MLITLSHCTAICQSVAEVYLTGVTPLGAVSHILFFFLVYILLAPKFMMLLIVYPEGRSVQCIFSHTEKKKNNCE